MSGGMKYEVRRENYSLLQTENNWITRKYFSFGFFITNNSSNLFYVTNKFQVFELPYIFAFKI